MLEAVLCQQEVRGVIFASGLKREVFTAGNDIKELYAPQTSMSRCAHPHISMLQSVCMQRQAVADSSFCTTGIVTSG